jgi:DNA-binding transcriptional regulator PaaX
MAPIAEPAQDRMTLSRRYAAGASGTRGLLLTVLGEFVLPTGRPAPTSAFIDVFGRLGVEEKTSRQTLMRASADGGTPMVHLAWDLDEIEAAYEGLLSEFARQPSADPLVRLAQLVRWSGVRAAATKEWHRISGTS